MIHNLTLRQAAFCALLLAATTTGCEVLEQTPPTAQTTADAFADADRIGKSAIGMYDALQNLEFLGGRALIYSDVRSDDVDPSSNFNDISTFNAQPNNAQATNAWTGAYRTIYGANFFMQQLQANTGKTTPALEAQYIGEAKFIRALVYFHLVNLYAQPYNFTADASHAGVPIQLVAPDAASAFDPSQQLSRSSVRDVYAQIEKDLNEALVGLPESYTAGTATLNTFNNTSRATKDAARTLLSRVALYKGQYAEAARLAGEVITGGRHSLNASPATPFQVATFNTSESIFSVAMNQTDNPNTNNALGQHYKALAHIVVTPYARIDTNAFRGKDRRRTLLLTPPTVPVAANTSVLTQKYSAGSGDNVPIARYSEVLLNRAEGLAQTDNVVSADAITLLNQVRNRSKPSYAPAYTAANFANKQALIDAILLERRIELAFEGHRYYDLMRYKRNASRITYGADRAILPIPLVDIQQNPNLVQNPGY